MSKRTKQTPIVSDEMVVSRIYTVRGCKVMLDGDLAALYQVETRALNQAIKGNRRRFPEDFMFALTPEEWEILKSQVVTSSWGGRRKLPLVFSPAHQDLRPMCKPFIFGQYSATPSPCYGVQSMTTAALKKKIKALVEKETSEKKLAKAYAVLATKPTVAAEPVGLSERLELAEKDFKAGRYMTGAEARTKLKAALKRRRAAKGKAA